MTNTQADATETRYQLTPAQLTELRKLADGETPETVDKVLLVRNMVNFNDRLNRFVISGYGMQVIMGTDKPPQADAAALIAAVEDAIDDLGRYNSKENEWTAQKAFRSLVTEYERTRERLRELEADYATLHSSIRELYHRMHRQGNVYTKLEDAGKIIDEIMYMASVKLVEHRKARALIAESGVSDALTDSGIEPAEDGDE